MTLVLEIEYLSGVCFARISPDRLAPDWPPQPDRIFSALVATWAAHGEPEDERGALEWLEAQPPPRLVATAAEPRTAATIFVPPNDARSDRQKNAKGVLPILRSRQPRRFPATRPFDPVLRFFWSGAAPNEMDLAALNALARDTAYVGHSASLTRCRFSLEIGRVGLDAAVVARRGVYAGRMSELRRSFEAGRRPAPGAPAAPAPESQPKRANVFGDSWLFFEHLDGEMPDVRACALVGKALRDALLSGYGQVGLAIPEVVSGHASDGAPTRATHVAIVPLSFVGFPYADGRVMGLAVVPPSDCAILRHPGEDGTPEAERFRKVLRILAPMDEKSGRRALRLTIKGSPGAIFLSPTFEPAVGKRSLDPKLYTKSARTFSTVTPVALDRHLKKTGQPRQAEIAAQIAAACCNIGLPEPEAVVPDKHSAIEGAPSAYPSGSAPQWMRWRLPKSLATRQLTHAVIRFAEPVEGPVIIGAGRFVGLGLCRPLDDC